MIFYIKQLHIENFKSFKKNTVDFNRLTVLAGANSVGKSTVIQSLLLSRLLIDNSSTPNGNTVSINGNYLMQLGFNSQIANSYAIKFHYLFENVDKHQYPFHINFRANPNESYLISRNISEKKDNSSLFAPNFHYLNAERIGPRPSYGTRINQLPSTGYQGEIGRAHV